MRDVRKELTGVFRDVFDDDTLEVRDETTAKDVDGWDSLTNIDLVVAVEKHFKIKLTTRDVAGLKNVGELVKLVEQKTGGA
jgi:acyl carrier protein